jgi:hypothetical protein
MSLSLSSINSPSDFLPPKDEITNRLVAKEIGGVAISDPSQGFAVKIWTARWTGGQVTIEADDVPTINWIAAEDVSDISLTFDQNMRPVVAWTNTAPVAGFTSGFMRWFDSVTNSYITTEYPGARDMRVSLDDKRPMGISESDIILTYIRNNNLYCRIQRDRYGVEYLLRERVSGRIRRFGMNDGLRMQWEIMPVPRDYTVKVPADPSIEIGADDRFTIEPEPIYTLPVTRRDPCGEC